MQIMQISSWVRKKTYHCRIFKRTRRHIANTHKKDESGKGEKTDKRRRNTCICKGATPSSSRTSQSQAVAFSQSTRWVAVPNGRSELNAATQQSSFCSLPGDGAMVEAFHCFRNCHRLTTAHPSARGTVSLHWNVGSSRVIESWCAYPFSPVLQTSSWVVSNQMSSSVLGNQTFQFVTFLWDVGNRLRWINDSDQKGCFGCFVADSRPFATLSSWKEQKLSGHCWRSKEIVNKLESL